MSKAALTFLTVLLSCTLAPGQSRLNAGFYSRHISEMHFAVRRAGGRPKPMCSNKTARIGLAASFFLDTTKYERYKPK